MAQAPDVGDRNSCTSLQPRFAAMATGSGERLLFARGFSGGALWGAGAFYVFNGECVAVESWSG